MKVIVLSIILMVINIIEIPLQNNEYLAWFNSFAAGALFASILYQLNGIYYNQSNS